MRCIVCESVCGLVGSAFVGNKLLKIRNGAGAGELLSFASILRLL